MKIKQRVFKIFAAVIVALTALSLFAASYTFAAYFTSANGTGTSPIALWDVTITPQTNATAVSSYDGAISFGKLTSGDVADLSTYTSASNDQTVNLYKSSSAKIYLASVKYKTSVDLKISAEATAFTISFNDGTSLTYKNGEATASSGYADSVCNSRTTITGDTSTTYSTIDSGHSVSGNSVPTASDIVGLYSLQLYNGDKELTSGTAFSASENSYTTLSIYGVLSWQIQVTYSNTANYSWATYLSDWVGKYVDSVACTLTYSAAQASELGGV